MLYFLYLSLLLRAELLPKVWKIFRLTLRSLAANDLFRMAGATAFFTTFALPPMVLIIARVLGLFLDRQAVGNALIGPLGGIFGPDTTASIVQTIRSFRSLQDNYLISAGIFLFLLFVATTLFKIIRDAINQLWGIRAARGRSLRAVLLSRAISLAVILAGGVLFLTVQLVDAGQQLLGRHISAGFQQASHFLGVGVNVLIVALISALWFYLLFRALPDGRPTRSIALGGAFLTGILFTAGKAVLGLLLRPVQVSNFYGVSGAFALLLLFMFYSSIFLYFGAAFIGAWSEAQGQPVAPKAHAERYRIAEDEDVSR